MDDSFIVFGSDADDGSDRASSSSRSGIEPVLERRPLASCFDSSPPVSGGQATSLLELLTGKLESGADQISLSRDQVQDIVQRLRGPKEESTASAGSSDRELAEVRKKLKIQEVHRRLGDYAGKVYDDLKDQGWGKKTSLLAKSLAEDLDRAAAQGTTVKVTETFERAVDNLPQNLKDRGKMPVETAQFAVASYGDRNLACHSGVRQLKDEHLWIELGNQLSKDLRELHEILPDDQLRHRDKWSQIITYNRDSYVRPGSDPREPWLGVLDKRLNPPSVLPRPFDPTTVPVDCRPSLFLAGRFRGPGPGQPRRRERRISDPEQYGKRKRDDEFPLDDEPLAKKSRFDGPLKEPDHGAPWGTGNKKKVHELMDALLAFHDKDPTAANEHVKAELTFIKAWSKKLRKKEGRKRKEAEAKRSLD
ncbi:MAG: hypothetical protein Q9182_006483 [Xanthomendoza sp. 2 TL-2023]